MWNKTLDDNLEYVLQLLEDAAGKRTVSPREVEAKKDPNTKLESHPYSGKKLKNWLRQGVLKDNIRLLDDSKFILGPHGEWMTECEFSSWKQHLAKNSTSIDNLKTDFFSDEGTKLRPPSKNQEN